MKQISIIFCLICLFSGCSNSSYTVNSSGLASEPPALNNQQKSEVMDDDGPLSELLVGYENFDLAKVDLSELPTEIRDDPWVWEPGIHLVASIPNADIALYGPLNKDDFTGILVRKGEQLAKFDWELSRYLFHAGWGDYDNDGNNEIAVGNSTAQGMKLYLEDLHIMEVNSDGSMEDFCMPEELYMKDLTQQLSLETNVEENQLVINMGSKISITYTPNQMVPKIIKGKDGILHIYDVIHYYFNENDIIGKYGVLVNFSNWNESEYAAEIEAKINYSKSEFTLIPTNLLKSTL